MLLCTLALFAVSLGYGVVVPLLPQLAGEPAGAQAASAISIIYVVYAAAKIGAQVPGGAWVDAAGGRRVLRVGMVLFSLSLAGFLFPGGIAWFSLVRALEGAATGLVYPAVFALVLRGSAEQGSGKRIGTVVGIGSSGLLAGPALGFGLIRFGHAVPILAALAVAVALTVAALWPARDEQSSPDALHANENIWHANDRLVAARRTVSAELSTLGRYATSAAFVGLCLPIAFNKLTFTAFQGLLPIHGPAAFGLGTGGVNLLFVLTGVVFGLAQPIGGALVDRFPARGVALALTLPLLAALAAMAWTPSAITFAAAWALYVAASSIIFTATLKHAARAFGTEDTYGGVFGVLGTLTDLMTIVGPLVFLNLYPRLGAGTFLAMAAAGVPFALGYLVLARAPPKLEPGDVR